MEMRFSSGAGTTLCTKCPGVNLKLGMEDLHTVVGAGEIIPPLFIEHHTTG